MQPIAIALLFLSILTVAIGSVAAADDDPATPNAPKQIETGVFRQVGFTGKKDPKAATQILRTADDLKKIPAELQAAAKAINVDEVDFDKQMVVIIAAGQTNSFGVRITVDKLEPAKGDLTATLQWTFRPYFGGAAPPDEQGNPGAIAVVKRFDGDVKFEKAIFRWPDDQPLPPSAGPIPEGPLQPG